MVEGFKNTEVGMIPNDWEVRSYGEVFEFLNTATYSRADTTDNDEIGYIHYGDIHTKWNFYLDISKNTIPTIPKQKMKKYSLIKDGDVVMADASEDYSGIGKSIEISNVKDRKLISGLHTYLFRDTKGSFVNGYRSYLHTIPIVKKQFDELATGMKVYGVSKNNLKKVLIPIPTLAEQTAIATALSDADALINQLEQLLTKKRNIKTGAMQDLLRPKEGWVVKKLGDLFEITSSKRVFQSEWTSDGIPFYRARELAALGENGFVDNELFITNEMYEDYKRQYGIPEIGDMLVTGVGTLGKTFLVSSKEKFYFKDGNIIWFQIRNSINSFFLQQLFLTPSVKKQIEDGSAGTTVGTYTINGAKKTVIPFPPLEEQTRIAQILSDMDNEIEELEKQVEKYKMLKQGMMQNLLTGKIRLV